MIGLAVILAVDAMLPPLGMANVLPGKDTIAEYRRANCTLRCEMEKLLELGRFTEAEIVLQETQDLYKFWDRAQDIHAEYYGVYARRCWLLRLISDMGYEAFILREFPPPIPVWRFTRVR